MVDYQGHRKTGDVSPELSIYSAFKRNLLPLENVSLSKISGLLLMLNIDEGGNLLYSWPFIINTVLTCSFLMRTIKKSTQVSFFLYICVCFHVSRSRLRDLIVKKSFSDTQVSITYAIAQPTAACFLKHLAMAVLIVVIIS